MIYSRPTYSYKPEPKPIYDLSVPLTREPVHKGYWRSLLRIAPTSKRRAHPYQYDGLDNDAKHIRLVKLFPAGGFYDDLECEIIHAPLQQAEASQCHRPSLRQLRKTLPEDWKVCETIEGRYLFSRDQGETSWAHPDPSFCDLDLTPRTPTTATVKYEALSYTWQPVGKLQRLYVRGSHKSTSRDGNMLFATVQTGENLDKALRHLRLRDKPRVLWIDAVCINQNDVIERNLQVKRMAEIYTLANRVVVWLGPEADKSASTISRLVDLSGQVKHSKDGIKYPSPNAIEKDWSRSMGNLVPNFSRENVERILHRSWFGRLWIFQELQLANNQAVIQVGSAMMEVSLFQNALAVLDIGTSLPFLDINPTLQFARATVDRKEQRPFSWLLTLARQRNCSDPRDKVYAILGLASDAFVMNIKADYALSTAEVYRNVVLASIQHSGRLDLLTSCGYMGQYVQNNGLPSWVPDWSEKTLYSTSPHLLFASGLSRADVTYRNPDILEVSGLEVAAVRKVTFPAPPKPGICEQAMKAWLIERPRFKNTQHDERVFLDYLSILSGCRLRERFPETEWCCSGQGWANYLLVGYPQYGPMHKTAHSWAIDVVKHRTSLICDPCVIALGPRDALPDDIVCVLLGCSSPMLLRPTSSGQFRVVGECLASYCADARVLLGEIPSPWRPLPRHDDIGSGSCMFMNLETREETQEDPRLPPLPREWERIDSERTADDPEIFQRFKNTLTGETMNSDPRMLPDALRARGVPLRTFQLV